MTIVVIKEKEYTLSQYLEYGFKNQKTNVKYTYKLFGDFSKKSWLII